MTVQNVVHRSLGLTLLKKVTKMLPQYLYRSDSDKKGDRKLKQTINSGVFLTNLCNGGNGREIFDNPLSDNLTNILL